MSSRPCENDPLDTSQFRQRLDGLEKNYCCLHDRGIFLVTCTVFLETLVPLSLQVLRQTAWHWSTRHARLRARIDSNDDNYKDACFVEMSSLTVHDVPVQEVSHGDWMYVNETELEEKFDCTNGLLWRLRFVPGVTNDFGADRYSDGPVANNTTEINKEQHCPGSYDSAIIFVIHHCITDGIGMANLLGEYIDILTSILHGKPVPDVLEPECVSICNNLEPLSLAESLRMRLLALPIPGFSHALMRLIKRNIPMKTDHVPSLPVGEYQNPLHRIFPLVLSEVDTASLVVSCRQKSCTVQGAIQAAIGLSLAQVRPGVQAAKGEDSEYFKVQYMVPVNLRQRLKNIDIPNSAIRIYTSKILPWKTFTLIYHRHVFGKQLEKCQMIFIRE